MQGAAFTPDAMDAYLPRVVATCEAYLQQWASQDRINLVPAVRHTTRASNLPLHLPTWVSPDLAKHIAQECVLKAAVYI